MSTETDYLVDDISINNQLWACVSFITPELIKGCENRYINVRGVYGMRERAEDRCKELHKIDSTYGVYVVEVGKWIAWLDDQKSNVDANSELNKLMKVYKKERSSADTNYENRKARMKESNEEIPDLLEPVVEVSKDAKDLEIKVENEVVGTGKEIKYLKEDDPIHNQKYYCISFLTPEQLDNSPKIFNVRGFKVRGMFEKEEDAKARCKKLYETDQNNNIFIGDIGHWVSWSNNTENVTDIEYANKDLNKLIKATSENQEKASALLAEQDKNNMMKKSLENVDVDKNLDGIVSELIEESFDEDITTSQIEKTQTVESSDDDEDLDDVTRELEEAQKLYENMLKEQKNI
jgi:hypothetical protein